MSDSLVIIPTFNEKENIEKMIRKIFSLSLPLSLDGSANEGFHILIVDDGSPDGTAGIVKNLQREFSDKLFLEERKEKLGLGTAYIHGFNWALHRSDSFREKKYQYIFEMDADFSHTPDDLIRLREACVRGADVAVGSRYVKGGKVENWPTGRILMSKYASLYVRTVLWVNIHDTTAGFKCYRKKVLEAIDFEKIKSVGYAFQIEMKYTAHKLGFKVAEVPIVFKNRQDGISKMSMNIFKEAFWGVIKMRFKKIERKTP